MKNICVDLSNCYGLGDTLSSTPTIKKLFQSYNEKISVLTVHPKIFKNNKYINKIFDSTKIDKNSIKEQFIWYKTFNINNPDPYGVTLKHNVMDIKQLHAVSLGFMLTKDEMQLEFIPDEISSDFFSNHNIPKDYVLIHPSKTWDSRTWDKVKWEELINKLNELNISVVSVGKDSNEVGFFDIDKPVFEFNIRNGVNLINKTSLSETWWLIQNSICFITMDSGLLHLAGTTDANIIQLGSSINYEFRAPYRNGSQDYKYYYVSGSCKLNCASDMKYGVREWNSIMGVPPLIGCLENKHEFECHPSVQDVYNKVLDITHSIPKHYEFIEIGTCDYDTIIQSCDDNTVGISIEPIKFYLDNLPNKKNVVKLNAAFSDKDEILEIYYIDDSKIKEHNLPHWVRGCNSTNKPHEWARKTYGEELYDSLVTIQKTPTITWEKLVSTYKIQSIGFLKIDTEGFEHVILKSYFELCKKHPNLLADKIMFEFNESSNRTELINLLKNINDYKITFEQDDVILNKLEL